MTQKIPLDVLILSINPRIEEFESSPKGRDRMSLVCRWIGSFEKSLEVLGVGADGPRIGGLGVSTKVHVAPRQVLLNFEADRERCLSFSQFPHFLSMGSNGL
jgi:hypothetical protein